MVAIGNDELGGPVVVGSLVACPSCGSPHEVADSVPSFIQFVKCGDKAFMVGLKGRSVR
jgi:hypothetical protein